MLSILDLLFTASEVVFFVVFGGHLRQGALVSLLGCLLSLGGGGTSLGSSGMSFILGSLLEFLLVPSSALDSGLLLHDGLVESFMLFVFKSSSSSLHLVLGITGVIHSFVISLSGNLSLLVLLVIVLSSVSHLSLKIVSEFLKVLGVLCSIRGRLLKRLEGLGSDDWSVWLLLGALMIATLLGLLARLLVLALLALAGVSLAVLVGLVSLVVGGALVGAAVVVLLLRGGIGTGGCGLGGCGSLVG